MGHQPGSFTFSDGSSRAADVLDHKFGSIFFIDVGMSRGVDDSKGPLLLIHKDPGTGKTTATAIRPKGNSTVLWQG